VDVQRALYEAAMITMGKEYVFVENTLCKKLQAGGWQRWPDHRPVS